MSGEPALSAASVPEKSSGIGRFTMLLQKSEAARGFSLLSPTLLIMAVGILVPFAILIVMSLWTQVGFGFDTTPTTANYGQAAERPIYGALLRRSLWISSAATVATVLLSYPMAYFRRLSRPPQQDDLDRLHNLAILDELSAPGLRLESGSWIRRRD